MPLLPPQTDDELTEEPVESKYKRLLDQSRLPSKIRNDLYKNLTTGRGNPVMIDRLMREHEDGENAPVFDEIWKLRYPQLEEPVAVKPDNTILKQKHAVNLARGKEADAQGIFNTPSPTPPQPLKPALTPPQTAADKPVPKLADEPDFDDTMFDSWKTWWEAQTGTKLPENYDLKGMFEEEAKPTFNQKTGQWEWPKDFEFAAEENAPAQPPFTPPQTQTKKDFSITGDLTPPQDIGTFGRDLELNRNNVAVAETDLSSYRQTIDTRLKETKSRLDRMPEGQAKNAMGQIYNRQLATFKTELEKREANVANMRANQGEANTPVLGQDKFKSRMLPADKVRMATTLQENDAIQKAREDRDAAMATALAAKDFEGYERAKAMPIPDPGPGISARPKYDSVMDIFKPAAIKEGIRQFVTQDPRNAVQKYLPYGSLIEASEGAQILAAANRIASDQGTPEDESLVKDWQLRAEQDPNVVFTTLNTIAAMPGFAAEILTSGGLYSAAKARTLATMQKALGMAIKKMAEKNIAGNMSARVLAGTVSTMALPGVSARALSETIERVTPTIEAGKVSQEGESLPSAIYKSFFNQVVEFASERSGNLPAEIAKGTGKWIVSKLPQLAPVAEKLEGGIRKILKTNGNTDLIDEMLTRMGYNGFLGEMAEERIGEIARFLVGVEDKYEVPSLEDLAKEAIAFGVIPGGSAILRKFTKLGERKPASVAASDMERKDVIEPQPFNPSTLGGDELIAGLHEEFKAMDELKAKRAAAKPVDVYGAVSQWTMVNSALNDILGTINQRGHAGGEAEMPVLTNLERATPQEQEQVKYIVGLRQQARQDMANAVSSAVEGDIPWLETLARSADPTMAPFKSLAQVRLQQLTGESTLPEATQPEAENVVPQPAVATIKQPTALEAVRGWIADKLQLGAELIKPGSTTQDIFGAQTAVGDRRAMERETEANRRQPGTRLIRFRMDLDNFKALNDELGHQKGDEALQLVTDTLKQKGRPGDQHLKMTARPGGDEFALIMEVSETADLRKIAADYETAIASALDQKGLRTLAGGKEVGASMAGAEWRQGMSVEDWDAAADKAAIARKAERGVSQKRESKPAVDVDEIQTGVPKPTIQTPVEGATMKGRMLDTITYDVIMPDGDPRPGTVSIQVQKGWTDDQIIAEAQRAIGEQRQAFAPKVTAEPAAPDVEEKTWLPTDISRPTGTLLLPEGTITPQEKIATLTLPQGVSVEFRFIQEGFADIPASEAFDINIEGGPKNITIQLAPGEDLQQRVTEKLKEFEKKSEGKSRESAGNLDVSQLPDYAKSAIFYRELGRITNAGGQTPSDVDQVLRDYAQTWELVTVPIESLRAGNEMLFESASTFRPRGSMTKGPIVISHSGEVIDGNNRAYEALQRGKTEIQVYRPVGEKPIQEQKKPELIKFAEGDRVTWRQNGETLTGTVRTSGSEELSVKTDQIAYAGGVPIGRVELVRLTNPTLKKLETEKKAEPKEVKPLSKNAEASLQMALKFAQAGKKDLMDEFIDEAKTYDEIPAERLEEIYAALPQAEPKKKAPKTLTPPPQQEIFETGHYVVTKDDETGKWILRHKDTREPVGVEPFLTAEEGINQANAFELLRHGRGAKFGDVPESPKPPKLEPPIPDVVDPDAVRKAELKAKRDAALERMRERQKGRLTSGIDPEDLIDAVEIGVTYLEEGYISFRAWSRQMLDFVGNEIEEFLEVIYNRTLRKNPQFAEAARQANERERLEADGPDQLEGDQPEKLPGGGEGREPGSDPGLGGRGLSGPDEESQRGGPGDVGGPIKIDRPATDDIPGGGIIRPARRNERFHRITSPETLGFATPKERFKKNIEAISHFLDITARMRELDRDRQNPYIPTAEDRRIVAEFVGWGAIPQAFAGYGRGWDKEYDQLRSILTPDQWKAAYFSTLNAHYTSGPIVQAMWRMALKLGFSGGSILEPAFGIGNFVGLAPQRVVDNSDFYGVEMDDLTAKMAQFIYPGSTIAHLPFQELAVENSSKDLIITNVPFGDMNVADTRYDLNFTTIHDYYFVRSLDILKPGGLMIAITSTGTMDKQSSTFRNHIGTRADLVAAYRLPNNAFEKNAGTRVTTDILIFRKRFPGEERGGENFSLTTPWGAYDEKMQPIYAQTKDKDGNMEWVKDKDGNKVQDTIPVNEYFEQHPDHMFGTLVVGQGLNGRPDKTLMPRADSNIELFFEDMTEKLPANIFGADPRLVQDEKFGNQRRARVRVGSIKIKDGQLHVTDRTGDLRPLKITDFVVPKSYVGKDGKRRTVPDTEAGKLQYVSEQLDGINRVKAIVELRDMALDLRNKQVETDDDELIQVMQRQLNALYDAYADKYGPLHSDQTWRVFRNDPDYPFMLALEDHNPETKENKKAAIFFRRIAYPSVKMDALSTDAREALLQVMAERGRPDLDHMARLWNKPLHEVVQTLVDADLIYKDPASGLYETAEQYLSGFLRTKLRLAEQFAKDFPQYRKNITALQKAIADNIPSIPMEVIYAKPGATWIPPVIYKAFFNQIFRWAEWKGDSGININSIHGNWIVEMGKTESSVENKSEWGATQIDSKFTAGYLFKLLLNQQIATVAPKSPGPNSDAEAEKQKAAVATSAVRAKQKELLNAFIDYARTGPYRDQMEVEYNYHFNNVRLREYDGTHLTLPGMDPEVSRKFYPHQRNVIWRLMQEGRGLVAHAVGAGKTFSMIGAAMELKRIGAARKSLFVVPNHLVAYWAGEINKLYPNAKVLAARQEDFTGETEEEVAEKKAKAKKAPPDAREERAISLKRKLLFEQIGTGDHDIVVLSHSSFGYLPIDPRHEQLLIQDQIDQIFDAMRGSEGQKTKGKAGSRHVKQLAKSMQKLQERMQKLIEQAKNRTDDTITFDQMGFDHMFVDESHAFKNMPFYTKMGSISGLSSGDSQRATNMMVKARYMQQKRGGRGVIFATATPITRTLAEIYINTRYIAPDLLTAAGIRYFDDWAANFGEVIEVKEMGVSGKFKVRTKFSKFLNVPELSTMFRAFTDVKLADEINLAVPEIEGGKPRFIDVEPTEQVLQLFKEIEERVEALEKGKVDPKQDNWFKVSVDGRKLAIDPRMMKARAEDDPGSIVNATVKVLLDTYKKYDDVKGTQIVFCELYRLVKRPSAEDVKKAKELGLKPPKDEQLFHLWEDIKTKLLAGGVKPSEIVDMGTIEGDADKEDVFRRMRAGDIRFLFGTTAKMGTGTNVQTRLVNLIHMDPTWNPADMEQRTGRIMRPGNKVAELLEEMGKSFPGVNVTFMLAVKTFAGYMYQNIQTKQIFIKQIMSGRYKDRTVIDAAGDTLLNAGSAKAIISGNPLIEIYEKKKQELNDLRIEEQGFYSTLARLREQMKNMEYYLNYSKREKARYEKIKAQFDAATDSGNNFVAVIDGHLFIERDKAIEYWDLPPRIRESVWMYGVEVKLPLTESWIGESSPDREFYKGHPDYKESGGFKAPRIEAKVADFYDFKPYLAEMHIPIGGELFTRVRQWLGFVPNRIKELDAKINQDQEDIDKTKPLTDRKWNKGAEIAALEQEIKDIEVQLKLREEGNKDDQVPDVTPDTPDAEEEDGPDAELDDEGDTYGSAAISPRFSLVGEESEPEPLEARPTYQADFGIAETPEGELVQPIGEPEAEGEEFFEPVSEEELTMQAELTEADHDRLDIAPLGGGTPMKFREMLNALASDIQTYIAVSKLPKRVGGEYNPSNAAVRIRAAGMVDVAIHEVGHFLDDQFGIVKLWAGSRKRSPFDKELLGNFARYGSVTKNGPRSSLWYQRAEGVAEWVRAWAFNPEGAAELAPKFHDYVINNKPPKGVPPLNLPPEVIASIRRFGDRVRAWSGMDRRNMGFANVRMDPQQKSVYEQVKSFYEGNNLEFHTTFWDRYVRSALADKFQPFHKAVEFLKGMRSDIESILPGNDPSILLGAYSGFSQKAAVVLQNGMINAKGGLAKDIEGGIRWLAGENDDGTMVLDTSSETAYKEEFVDTVMYGLYTRIAYRGDKIFEKAYQQIDAISYAMQLSTGMTAQEVENDEDFRKRKKAILDEAEFKAFYLAGFTGGTQSDYRFAKQALREMELAKPEKVHVWKEMFRRYNAWSDAVLRYWVDKGRLSEDAYQYIKDNNEQYYAMNRIITDGYAGADEPNVGSLDPSTKVGFSRKLGFANQPLQVMRGSLQEIQNPYESLIYQTFAFMREADRNEILDKFTTLLTNNKRTKMHEGLQMQLAMVGQPATAKDRDATLVYKDGKDTWWRFPDKGLFQAIDNWGKIGLSMQALDMLGVVTAKVPRWLITHGPGFVYRSFIREPLQRGIISRVGSVPQDVLKGYTEDELDAYMLAGGSQKPWNTNDVHQIQKEFTEAMKSMVESGSVKVVKTKSGSIRIQLPKTGQDYLMMPYLGMKKAFQSYGDFVQEYGEVRNRMAEFKKAFEYAKQQFPNWSDYDASLWAAHQARDLLDYYRVGWFMEPIVKIIPFLNSSIQGKLRAVRGMVEEFKVAKQIWEKGDKTGAIGEFASGFMTRFMTYVVLPRMLCYAYTWMMGDDDEYRKLPAWRRLFFLNIKPGIPGTDIKLPFWVVIPTPFELGFLGAGVELAIEAFRDENPEAWSEFANGAWKSLLPMDDFIPSGPVRGVVEGEMNYSLLFDRYLVPPWEEGKHFDLREGDRGSTIGRGLESLSRAFKFGAEEQGYGVDARKIDNFISNVSGSLGYFVNALTDTVSGRDPRGGTRILSSLGVITESPSGSSTDVQWVMRISKALGDSNSREMRQLGDLMRFQREGGTLGERSTRAQAVRAYAAQLKTYYSALYDDILKLKTFSNTVADDDKWGHERLRLAEQELAVLRRQTSISVNPVERQAMIGRMKEVVQFATQPALVPPEFGEYKRMMDMYSNFASDGLNDKMQRLEDLMIYAELHQPQFDFQQFVNSPSVQAIVAEGGLKPDLNDLVGKLGNRQASDRYVLRKFVAERALPTTSAMRRQELTTMIESMRWLNKEHQLEQQMR